ncbi:pro-resilin [Eurytemora carolleeae]|uniref:pro-resilin n=1 Tax=Eurytemora carolleeae TaxID=1294199 RepID=UPI000C785B1B|nr:pro-resilin [Eurytemora carolleeae]|eukprot:XP_023349655.1 pro-resilin-like [Eurytemora affinis]
MQTIIVLASLVSAALCIPAGPPAYGHEENYDTPAAYAYQYGVADDYSGAKFEQNEKRDGYSTSGSYRVALPDGRIQIVNYHTADAYSGNIADVTYEGTPTYGPGPARAVHAAGPAHLG